MQLVVLPADYGSDRYFIFYIMENGKCLTARWSKKFKTTDKLSCQEVVV